MDRKYLEILKKSWKCIKDWPWSRIRLILRAVLLVLAPLLTVLACQTISLQGGGEAAAWMGNHGAAVAVTWLILVLAELAVSDAAAFAALTEKAKAALN